jgi:DNA-binding MarR family transcriptional regulator
MTNAEAASLTPLQQLSSRDLLSPPQRAALLDRLAEIAPKLKEAELRLAIHMAHTCNVHYSLNASSRQLATATGLARSKVITAIDSLGQRGFITTREGTATRPGAYTLSFAAVVPFTGPLTGPPPQPNLSPKGTTPLPFGDHLVVPFGDAPGPLTGPPPTENKGVPAPAPAVDIDTDSIGLLDRVLTAKKSHHDKRDLHTLREWVDGYWTKLGPNQPNPHPVDDTILAQLLSIAPLQELIQLLKTLFTERKRPELSPAWFVAVALQRIHGIRPETLKARRADLRAVRRPQAPEPTQDNLEFAGDLIADLAKPKGMAGR